MGDLPFLPKGIRKGFVEVDRDALIAYIKRARSSADTLAKFEAEGKDNAQIAVGRASIEQEFSWEEAEPIYREMVKRGQITGRNSCDERCIYKIAGSKPDNSLVDYPVMPLRPHRCRCHRDKRIGAQHLCIVKPGTREA